MSTTVGIDIGDDAVRIVELAPRGGGFVVKRAGNYPLPKERTPQAIAEALAAVPIGGGQVAIGVPASACAFKVASLPPGRPAQLAQIVTFEAETQFPLPLAELAWGHAVSPDPSGRTHASLVGARRAIVEERLALLRRWRAVPTAVQVAALAAADAVPAPDGRYLVVWAGVEWCDLCLYEDRRLLGCRSILAGHPSAVGWADRLEREIRPWMAHATLAQVIVLGNVTPEAASTLGQALRVTIEVGDPWADVANARECLAQADDAPAAYAAALGLAKSAARRGGINLLPAELLRARAQRGRYGVLIAVCVLLAALLTPFVLQGHTALQQRRAELAELSASATGEATPVSPALREGLQAAQLALEAQQKVDSSPVEILRRLYVQLPTGITLTDFVYDRGRTLVLKGRATTHGELTTAMAEVRKLGMIERAMLEYANLVSDTDAGGYSFQITCHLLPVADPTKAPAAKGQKSKSSATTGTAVAR